MIENPHGKCASHSSSLPGALVGTRRSWNILSADIDTRVVSGHGFSRAATVDFRLWALAPEIFLAGAKALISELLFGTTEVSA
jgi:hypothetical protein